MKASKDLFILISSLSKSEKGYFKKFTSLHVRGEENQYVKLFDIIEKQEEYDEHKVIDAMGQTDHPKNFAVLKSYLYDLILKSLRSYYSQSTPELEIKELIEYIEILHNKGLYKQCEKIINKGIALAEKYELFLPLAELYGWKIEFMHLQNFTNTSPEELDLIYATYAGFVKKYQNIISYKHILSQLFVDRKTKGFTRNKEELAQQEKSSKNKILLDINYADSYQAKWHYYLWYSVYSFSKHDYESSYKYTKTLVDLIESHPNQKEFKPKAYTSALNNLLVMQIETNRYGEIMETLKKVKLIVPRSESIKQWLYYVINASELNLYMNTGEFEKAMNLAIQIEKQLPSLANYIIHEENELILIFNLAITFFGSKNYPKANYYFNKIIHESSMEMRTDVHCFARIMSLIVHSEMGNNDMLEYTIKSTYRFLYKRNRLYKFETLILNFIKTNMSAKALPKNAMDEKFKILMDEIDVLKKDHFERKALNYFDFISWLESKIENRPFADIVRDKTKMFVK